MKQVTLRAFLTFELLVGLALIATIVTVLKPLTQSILSSGRAQSNILASIDIDRGVRDQLQAQWRRLGLFGCDSDMQVIEVGSAFNRPARIPKSTFEPESDWMSGSDVGLCAKYGTISGNELQVSFACDGVEVGQAILASSCGFSQLTNILGRTSGQYTALVNGSAFTSQHVLVGTVSQFFWYIGKSKRGINALWRKPVVSGNAVELFPYIRHMRIYPILDTDQDGTSDEIAIQYGAVVAAHVKGVLVEYYVELAECDYEASAESEHLTLRGDRWVYDGICQSIGKAIVPFGGGL